MKRTVALFVAAAALSLAPVQALRAETSPIAEGKTLFEGKCASVCHGLDRALAIRADRAGWEGKVKRMVAAGAKLDEAQVSQIVGYLTAKSAFETKCATCHNTERSLTAIKNADQWKATVQRMVSLAKGNKQISDADAGAIALYLSLVAPVKPAAPAAPAKK